jgi:hypothetical protein
MDLNKNKYSMEELKKHIYDVNLRDILKTQKINEAFAIKYILNPNYQLTESEKTIDVNMVIFYQPHLKKKTLFHYLKTMNVNDDETDIKFDEYANR